MNKKRFKELDKEIQKLEFMIPDGMTRTKSEFIENLDQ